MLALPLNKFRFFCLLTHVLNFSLPIYYVLLTIGFPWFAQDCLRKSPTLPNSISKPPGFAKLLGYLGFPFRSYSKKILHKLLPAYNKWTSYNKFKSV